MGENKRYYLGLDMGTNSLGWAVTDSAYQLMRAKGKDLWGVRTFEEANTSAERRSYRISRRRRQRQVARMGVLRELFADEIEKMDAGFFVRLDESKYHLEDRSEGNRQKYALFSDENFTDWDYFAKYPTIFHLRKELLESEDSHDVRLVYLALANMFKHRGHFLNASLGTEDASGNFQEVYQQFIQIANEFALAFPGDADEKKLELCLGGKESRKKKTEIISEQLGISRKQKAEYQLINLMCGLKGKIADVFPDIELDEENKNLSISFRDSDYEEKEAVFQNLLDEDEMELVNCVKQIHDRGLLSGIEKGYKYLSQARVASYEEHHKDLQILKNLLKKYDKKAYFIMFRNLAMGKGSYSSYIGSVNAGEKCRRGGEGGSQEEFYKKVKSILSKFPSDDPDVRYVLEKIETETFLPKQLTASNGVIPNQVHAREMKKILKNAETYLPFLKEKDDSGLSVSEKIVSLFTFRIPYYVGPLGQQYKDKKGYNVWAERKAPGKIYPWNFTEKVDEKKSAEKFIARMVRHCTYMAGHTSLPKQSLLYEKYQVLNELNNLRIHGEKISVELKQDIYHTLFEKGKKVSLTALKRYLITNGIVSNADIDTAISGIDNGFQSSLSSLGKFLGVLGEEAFSDLCRPMIEQIIFWGTVYGDDKKFLKEKIEEAYGNRLTDAQKKRISGFKFSGWGNLSKEFLTIEGASKEDGEIKSLMQSMWDTNCNLMELLSDRFTYKASLDAMVENVEKPLSEWRIEDLDELYLSAPVKRMVWQTIRVVDEIQTVLGNSPERIFVEMAREEGEKGKRTVSRKRKLLDLYHALGKEGREWKEELENTAEDQFRMKKLYLYYLQMGRCIYTGETIDLHDLMNGNKYDIDHIYPRHFIKDDNIENNLVLVKKEKNAHKSDNFPIEKEIHDKMQPFWQSLWKKGLMSIEKYNRLTRKTPFTDEEKANFISRQLVETRQGTKAITQIFHQAFPESEIVFSKASVVSAFRKKYEFAKVRCVNNYHHAHDAYLNIVVGNTYFVKFTKNPLNFIKEANKHPENPSYKYNMDKIFEWDVQRNGEVAWIASKDGNAGSIKMVRKMLNKNSPLMTRLAHEAHGGLTQKTTIWSAQKANMEAYLPIKTSDPRLADVTKYGGPTTIAVAGYTLLEYKVAGKTVRSLESLPIYLGKTETLSEEVMLEYFSKILETENKKKKVTDLKICIKLIPRGSLVKYDGFYYYLAGKTGNRIIILSAVSLCLSQKYMYYIKKMEKAVNTGYYEEKVQQEVILTKEKNEELYHIFCKKYKEQIFAKKVGVMGNTICDGEARFWDLDIEQQCKVILQILLNFQSGVGVDLTLLGGSNKSGITLINKKISGADELLLIYQSITGIYSREINLLTV